ncbi:MAG: sodium/proline symporter, partial [Pseudomonadota bacterium]
GILSAKNATNGDQDYLLANKSVPPVLAALSAAATKNSGYMFIALIGYIYTFGLSAIWLLVGFLFGDLIAFFFVHSRVRDATEETGASTFAELLSRWNGRDQKVLRFVVGLLTLVFLSTYAAAQFSAGGKALEVLFGWPNFAGALLGAGLVLAYCWAGGLRASIWTDAAQALLMVVAMWLLMHIAVSTAGGFDPFFAKLEQVEDHYFEIGQKRLGGFSALVLFALGWMFNGIGVTGQPQVMVRFMALDRSERLSKTAFYYFSWNILFLIGTFMVGLATRLYLGSENSFDQELALPMLAQNLVPGIAVGVIIGGVFAASISTADSQVLSCAAVLSEDFKLLRGPMARHIATAFIVVATLLISQFASANVFTLVIFAWSALACSLGPLVILLAFGQSPSQPVALFMLATGLLTALIWREFGLNAHVYEGMPGMLAGFSICIASRLLWPSKAVSASQN